MTESHKTRPSRLLVVVDILAWQGKAINEKNATRAFEAVLREIYYSLGATRTRVDRRCVIVRIDNEDPPIDTMLERFEGVQLVGKERPIKETGSAILAVCKSQILLGHPITAYVVTDRGRESAVDSTVSLIGGLSNLSAGYMISWSAKASTELFIRAIPKQELGIALKGASNGPKDAEGNAWYLDDDVDPQGEGATTRNEITNRVATNSTRRATEPTPKLEAKQAAGILKASQPTVNAPQQKLDEQVNKLKATTNNPKYLHLDFVPLVIAIRTIELGVQEGTIVLRSTVGEALKAFWPIGREKYKKFGTYVAAAKTAGVVQLGTSGKIIWIASTGKFERIFKIKPARNYTESWPKVT